MTDLWHMRTALGLARRGLGTAWPNPSVGCVIVREGQVVGRGWTAKGGRPHAEAIALAQAEEAARGATAYVTLEPCAHHGKTPPCAGALIAAGIVRVVVALGDPDRRVDGQGIAMLRQAGIAVETGLLADEAERVTKGFLTREREGRPIFTLKLATTLDGRMATSAGESQWITGDLARARGHLLRATHDAILVGAGTARADNPSLTCRLKGLEERSPLRIVLDARGDLPGELALFQEGPVPTWRITGPDVADAGGPARQMRVPLVEGRIDLLALARILGAEGLTRVLVEGGGQVAAGFAKAGLVDRIEWFRAPSLLGGDGLAAIGELGVQALTSMPGFRRVRMLALGDDVMESFERRAG
jgi:diaminohydroxyphosphoribosylaminopyrimidine deaminase/5-amino-6-(5-phosphoribosylamino)uracil reductase